MDNCCDALLKYLLFILNFFLFITGCALIAVGAYVQTQMKDYLNFLDESYLNASVLFIVLGVIILVIGFFGCCGACTESPCMMATFATLLAIVVITQLGLAIAVFVFRGQAHEVITEKMQTGMQRYSADEKSQYAGVTQTWNSIQTDFKCCGVTNYTDWQTTNFTIQSGGDLPDACCKLSSAGCGAKFFPDEANLDKINQEGCFQKLEDFVVDNATLVGGIAIAILVVQVILVLISCMLAGNMRRRSNYV